MSEGNAKSSGAEAMTNKSEMVSVPRELAQELDDLLYILTGHDSHPKMIRKYGEEFWVALDKLRNPLCKALAAPPEDARAVVDEPVQIIAVAVTREDDEEGLRLEWLLEGGISELEFAGTVLFAMPEANDLCDEDGSAELHRRPQRSEVSPQCSEQVLTQGKLLQPHTTLPHPPRHWGFLQPEREVPGYTLEQMKEYGSLCAAEALRQNK
jgi:hypothetical protein